MPLQVPITYLKDVKLDDPEVLSFFREWSMDALRFNMREDAFWFSKILETLMNEQRATALSDAALLKEYQEIIIRTRWVALSLLSENEIIDLFEKSFRIILLEVDFDAWIKLKERLIPILVYEERDALKRKVIDALLHNKEVMTAKPFQSDGKTLPATVGDWLRDYIQFVGAGPLDKVKQAQYFVESKNLGVLSEEERTGVMRLIHLYERCRLSSLTIQGMEEDMPVPPEEGEGGVSGVIREGRFEPDDPRLAAEIERDLEAVYPERMRTRLVQQAKQAQQALAAPFEGEEEVKTLLPTLAQLDEPSVRIQCFDALFPSTAGRIDRVKALACLQLVAERGTLPLLLIQDERFRKEYTLFLKEQGRTGGEENFRLQPGIPTHLGRFIRYALVKKINMSESESARFAVRLGNLMKAAGKEEYLGMAYFDQASGMFKWKM